MAQTPAIVVQAARRYIDYTPTSNVTAGDVVLLGSIPLVATSDCEAGHLGALAIDAVIDAPKDGSTFEAGDAGYWNATASPVEGDADSGAMTSTASGANLMGLVIADAAAEDSTVRLLMTAAKRTTTLAGSVTADDITGSDSSLTISGKAGVGAGTAGAVAITSGASAGATGTAGGLSIDCGAATGGTAGTITIGGANAGAIVLGLMPQIPTATVAAAGSAQANAAALVTGFTVVTGANGTAGVKLPAAADGGVCIVKNDEAANAALKVYPDTDDAVNALAANASLEMPAKTAAAFIAYDATTWYSVPRVPS